MASTSMYEATSTNKLWGKSWHKIAIVSVYYAILESKKYVTQLKRACKNS